MHVLIAALHRPVKPTGVCRHAVNLALCLIEREEVTKVTLVIGAWQVDYFKTAFWLNSDKIQLTAVDIKNSSISRNLWFLWGLPKLANANNPDIVHLSFPFPIFRFLFKAPVVSTIHDLYSYECPENFGFPQVWFNRLFLKQCIDNSHGLTCVSQVTEDKLKLYFPNCHRKKAVEVVYNYVDFGEILPKQPQQLDSDSRFILSVAQHRQNKNLALTIRAYHSLLQGNKLDSKTSLVIVGSKGPETDSLQRLITELNLESSVVFLSGVADSELLWLYKNCLLFVIASSTEGFCLPLVEALQFANTVVCSDIPIFKEVGSDSCNYFYLSGNSLENLSFAIQRSLTHAILKKSDRVEIFGKGAVAKKYVSFYRNLVKTN